MENVGKEELEWKELGREASTGTILYESKDYT